MSNIKYPWLKKYLHYFDADKLAHAQLFSGKSGIGKSYFSYELSKSLLCPNSTKLFDYCGKCISCNSFNSGTHPDFKKIQLEGENKVIKISQLRGTKKDNGAEGILNFSHETPLISKSKIVHINSAENMNTESQNFLLKTLEEPSNNTYIFLTSSKPFLLKPTLLSRLNHVSLSLPEKKETLDWLKSINVEINYQELNFLEDVNIIDLSSDLIIQARQEIDDFSSDLAKCNSSKKIEKIAAKWDDSNLLKKLNWLSKIIRNSIFLKLNQNDLKSPFFAENISYLADSKSLNDLFEFSNELNTLIDGLVKGVNLNNKLQIKALLSSY